LAQDIRDAENLAPDARLHTETIDKIPLSEYQWSGPGRHEPLKRAFDIVTSVILLAALGPLMLVVALSIRFNDGSPILVRQLRIGRFGRVIGLMKFRTMPPGAQKASRFGRFMIKSGIDKLPRFLNVLQGDLSLVGPKAVSESELPRYGLDVIYYLGSRPGLTGTWRTRNPVKPNSTARVALDREYARTRTFISDLKLLLATVPNSLTDRSAP
jgi:exopolysaccharide production protein ExoY